MKRFLAIAAAALLLVCGAAADSPLKDGVFTVETRGLNGPLTVVTTLQNGAVTAIEVPVSSETKGIGDTAMAMLTEELLAYQNVNLDMVSGATFTSGAFLRAVRSALQQAGGSASDLANLPIPAPAVPEDTEAEYVIIGAGSAGMASAVHAAELGLSPIVLEKMDIVGGTSVMGGVGTQAGSSNLQLAKAEPYTADEFYAYLQNIGVGVEETIHTVAPMRQDYAHTFAYRSADMMNWVVDVLGLPMQATADHSNAHSLASKENGLFGEQLVAGLKTQVKAHDIDVRTGHRATGILMEDGKVAGVKVSAKGGDYVIRTNHVLISTGSYGGGKEALETFVPSRLGYVSTASKAGTGDGLFLASEAGAKLVNLEAITYRTIAYGTENVGGAIGLHNAPNAGGIFVNKEGKRFVNEAGSGESIVLAIQAQTDGGAYVLMDQKAMDERYNVSGLYIPGTYETIFMKADTLEALAGMAGLDADALKETVETYAAAVAAGSDAEFGRDKFLLSDLGTAPYYLCWGKPSNHICAGGILTDGDARVLDENEQVIPGLFAAGETVNLGYHPIGSALTFGRQAAETVAAELGK